MGRAAVHGRRDGVFGFTDLEREQTTDDEKVARRWHCGGWRRGRWRNGQFTRQVFEDETYQHVSMIPARNRCSPVPTVRLVKVNYRPVFTNLRTIEVNLKSNRPINSVKPGRRLWMWMLEGRPR